MTNYYKYLPVSQQDEDWGLHVLDAGCNHIGPGEEYPSKEHPGHHYFNWMDGRVLHEYQLVYITRGAGYFESAHSGLKKIREGTVFILFPGEWHRFKPVSNAGWDEYWVGFDGYILKNLFTKQFFQADEPILHIGINDSILQLFTGIIETARKEKAGYQPLISGAVLHLLGTIWSIIKQQSIHTDDMTDTIINKAKVLLRMGIDNKLSIGDVADELKVSYSWFRQTFKTHTGMAPGQYLLQLRIEQAKLLLMDNSKSIKTIAYDLNFKSVFYFSSLFKNKLGVSPAQYRKKISG